MPRVNLLRRFDRPVFALIAIALIAGGLRLWNVSKPSTYVFDEVYYAKDGCLFAGYSPAVCKIDSSDEKYWYSKYGEVGSWVHPPLGKEMIGIGEKFFGGNSFGWRISAVVFGTASVVLT